jgi:hypothetical protein
MRPVYRLISSVWLAWSVIPALGGEVPLNAIHPQDLIDGYKLNFQKFKTLRVLWRHTQQNREGWFQSQKGFILRFEHQAKAAPSETERQAFLAKADNVRKQLNSPDAKEAVIKHLDFWTDRQRFQIRRLAHEWFGPEPKAAADFRFPDEPLDESTLPTAYKDIAILSFAGDLKAGFRCWTGKQLSGSFQGVIYNRAPEFPQGWLFPPLGVDTEKWGQVRAWHEMDKYFFSMPVANMTVRGTEKIGDKTTYLLTYSKEETDIKKLVGPDLQDKYRGKLRQVERITAWVDPSQGFLPLKMEWEGCYETRDDQGKVHSSYTGPSNRLEVKQIKEIPGGGFYPLNTVHHSLRTIRPIEESITANWNDLLQGKYAEGQKEVSQEIRCEAVKVEAGWPANLAMFELAFPKNTIYYDQPNQKGLYTSDLADFMKAAGLNGADASAVPLPGPSWQWRTLVLAVNAALIATVLGVFLWLRQRGTVKS